ncbi:hypothetical protein K443DRAFT_470296 [Laccaria amethystina LaAM-08-1]|uniref:Uncharacterized protein n=1 Tax=Laccaria amethystina LaAM-08-1 TaxID=1095629 RepID=A0A0C9X2D6_9AGAR|nr:hypothetical protein K443DRAFT_470296 [Laccaria amethystina LaAM-08-1]
MSFMSVAMNEQNIEIKPNNVLSDIDKAFMTMPIPILSPACRQHLDRGHALYIGGVDAEICNPGAVCAVGMVRS